MTKRSKAYLNAFRNIPRLFDYLLETLDERPQILEKNDADVFKRSVEEGGASVSNVYLFKRSIEDEKDVTNFGIQNDDNYFDDESYEENEPENGNIFDYVESDDDDEDKSGKDNSEFENMFAYSGLQFESFTTLTSDEVAENAMKVEKMLEEQNNRK
ncbi:hypothetical protein O0L34_g15126 [Tuta absoluta]|nr:hypothetical protein O0L34_g15126 [Tuta absoluta]